MSDFVTRRRLPICSAFQRERLIGMFSGKFFEPIVGEKSAFLRPDVESIASPEPEKTFYLRRNIASKSSLESDMAPFANLIREMHHEIQKKGEIAKLSFELGKMAEISKNSIPLLESKKKDDHFSLQIDHLQESLRSARNGRLVFFALLPFPSGFLVFSPPILWDFDFH